ncbi:MAG: magnesium transporter [Pseudomonadales bacterium]|nr:magnesium transporter [Pseudomonadales bacterium]MCP5185390.1 magnesium transporter [Pseudomonadales bacterium]
MWPNEIARLLESTPPKVRRVIWNLVDEDVMSQVLQYLHDDVSAELLETIDPAVLAAAVDELETDDFADLLQQLPQAILDQVLDALDQSDRQRLEAVLSYPDDTAGGIMNTDTITVRPRHSADVVLRYLRLRKDIPETTDALIVVNDKEEYVGMLPLTKLLTSDPSVNVREIMNAEAPSIPVEMPDTEVARLFSAQDLVSAAVVGPDGRLLGRITIDDVVDVIIEEADEAVLAHAGLDAEDDTFASASRTFPRRAVWLGVNLATAFLASAVINLFEHTIEKVVALAVLMPIVASMGGIAGTQTLTLVIRGIALGQVGRSNLGFLLNREFKVAALNGLFWAILVGIAATLVFGDYMLGVVLATAMIVNILMAAFAGTLLPGLLRRFGIDPAIAGGVVLTTFTDVTGFFAFLGLATWVYG